MEKEPSSRLPPLLARLRIPEQGMGRVRQAWLERSRNASETGIWPGPGPVESELAAPAWAMTSDEDAVDFDGVEE